MSRGVKVDKHLEADRNLLAELRNLVSKWKAERAHTYASENADLYRGFENGMFRAAQELERVAIAYSKRTGVRGAQSKGASRSA